MKKTILTIILTLMITNVIALYGGETIELDLPNTEPVWYEVTNNQSDLEGLTAYQNQSKFIISIAENMYPDNFTIKIYKNGTREVVDTYSGGGGGRGGSGSAYILLKLKPNETEIDNETKPIEPKQEPEPEPIEIEQDLENETSVFVWLIIIGGILGILGIIVYFLLRNEKVELEEQSNKFQEETK